MKTSIIRADPLGEKTLTFAIRIVNLNRYLRDNRNEYIISRQIMRSGTSPGAMVREAANAESGQDFIHKLAVAQKEIEETQYWLELLLKTQYITPQEFNSLHQDTQEIMKLLRSSILTKKKRLGNK